SAARIPSARALVGGGGGAELTPRRISLAPSTATRVGSRSALLLSEDGSSEDGSGWLLGVWMASGKRLWVDGRSLTKAATTREVAIVTWTFAAASSRASANAEAVW